MNMWSILRVVLQGSPLGHLAWVCARRMGWPASCWLVLGLHWLVVPTASGQLRIVDFNTANSGDNSSTISPRLGMDVVLQAIGAESVGGIAKPIDVLALQEQASSASTTQQIVDLLNGIYGSGTYARATVNGATLGGGRPGLIYNTQTVQLIQQIALGPVSSSGAVRQTLRYQLQPVGYGSDARFYVYSNHYKASTGGTNALRRDAEAQFVRGNADSLGEGQHIIFAGDYNIQSSSEAMYQTLLSAGPGQAWDPLNRPGTWHNSSAFRSVHTQSPYDVDFNEPALVGGGIDDRFDFQLVSGEFVDGEGLSYIAGSYHTFGNDGSHQLNDAINDPGNTAQPLPVLNALARVSDHLPVVADYQLPASMQVTLGSIPTQLLIGAPVRLPVTVSNVAQVVAAHGADELDYTVTGANGLSGTYVGTDAALGDSNTHLLSLETATPGRYDALVQVGSSSQAAAHRDFSETVAFTVFDHARPSFDPAGDVTSLTLDLGIAAPGSLATASFDLFNRPLPFAAPLDLDQVFSSGNSGRWTTDIGPLSNLAAGDHVAFQVTLDTSASGSFSLQQLLQLSDADLPGIERSYFLDVTVTGGVALPGDANLDGIVDTSDFNIWNAHKFQSEGSWGSGDFTGDGVTDASDFNVWNANKFTGLRSLGTVPEPSSWALGWLAGAVLVGRSGKRPRDLFD